MTLRLALLAGLLVLEKLLLGALTDYESARAQEPVAVALRLYQSRGFLTSCVQLWHHLWIENDS